MVALFDYKLLLGIKCVNDYKALAIMLNKQQGKFPNMIIITVVASATSRAVTVHHRVKFPHQQCDGVGELISGRDPH